jgi:F-type H+-transporting ATPase subunit a
MLIASGFSWFHTLPGIENDALFPFAHGHGYVVAGSFFACALVIGFALLARMGLNQAIARQGLEQFHPDETLSSRNVAEVLIGGIMGFMGDMMDRKYVHAFLPLTAGLFFYIVTCNLLAIVPGFQPPTDNINTNFGMAVVVALTYLGVGLALDAKGFIKHMLGPMAALAPLFLFLELLAYLAVRPGSLMLRLTGNIYGDHSVFNIMSSLVPVVVPSIFLALAILVSFIQASVFTLLTTVYISQSLPHGDHDDHGDHH